MLSPPFFLLTLFTSSTLCDDFFLQQSLADAYDELTLGNYSQPTKFYDIEMPTDNHHLMRRLADLIDEGHALAPDRLPSKATLSISVTEEGLQRLHAISSRSVRILSRHEDFNQR